MTSGSWERLVQTYISQGQLFHWSAAWSWSEARRLGTELNARQAGAMNHLVDLLDFVSPENAVDEVEDLLTRSGLIAAQPRAVPVLLARMRYRRRMRDRGPQEDRRKLSFKTTADEYRAALLVAAMLTGWAHPEGLDALDRVLLTQEPVGNDEVRDTHLRLRAALLEVRKRMEQFENTMEGIGELDG